MSRQRQCVLLAGAGLLLLALSLQAWLTHRMNPLSVAELNRLRFVKWRTQSKAE